MTNLEGLEIVKVSVTKNERFEALNISWRSKNLGFGQYSFVKNAGSEDWFAETERMDSQTDKNFGKTLLNLWMDSMKIEK